MSLFGRSSGQQAQSPDEQAIARYRYMLETAPPETLEQAHAEAFARLTPEQRRMVLQKLTEEAPPAERALAEQSNGNPQALARLATRAEIRQPGTMERMFGQRGGGMSMGGLVAGTLLSTIAGTVIGSAIANQFFASDTNAAQSPQDDQVADADEAADEGGGFDMGGFEDV